MIVTRMVDDLAPVRRSPLAAVHERLGARWISDLALWPAAYGSVELERGIVRSAAGLADLGPLVKVSVTAADVVVGLARIGLEGTVGAITRGTVDGIPVDAWLVAPDGALIVHPAADPADRAASAPVLAALAPAGLQPVDQSSGIAALVLAGPASRLVLGDCFPVDIRARVLADGHLTSGPVAGIRTVVGRLDRGGTPSFTLLVARDLAVSLWAALLETGARHGLQPVGGDALAGRSG